mgnify:CR=1 FL=1
MSFKKNAYLALVFLATISCGKKNSFTLPFDGYKLRLEVVSPEIVRVSAVPSGSLDTRESLVVLPQDGCTEYKFDGSTLTTEVLKVTLKDSTISFFRADGTPLALDGKIGFTPVEVEGKKLWSTSVSFESAKDEAFYGLGQHQAGELDHKGKIEELYQYNTKISIPIAISNKSYGILWDAYSLSRWGTAEPYRQLGEVFDLDLKGTYTAADGTVLTRQEDSLYYENEWAIRNLPQVKLQGAKVVYEGTVTAKETGDYHFIQYYAGFQSTEIGGEELVSRRWRPAWNPHSVKFTVHLEKGVPTPVRIDWEPDGDVSYIGLRVAPLRAPEEESRLTFWSEAEPSLDFYFMAGDNYDGVLRNYRTLTGKATIPPKWAMGFWQSRERYSTQEELVGTLAEFRKRHIPVDNIVQDWQYWEPDQWGSHEFESSRYPDPEAMLDSVHAMHGRFMISVWPKFYTNTEHYKELKAAGYAYTHAEDSSLVDWLGHNESFYDAYADGGRKMFWRQMDESLYTRFGRKIDAWWMDASEPNLRDCLPLDYQKWLTTPTALGPSTEYLNAYALVNAKAIYEGQRSVDPQKRVFLLTRNGFAGLQRYGAASWSGDIGTSWLDMRIQMAAGLGYSMSGVPVWGMDIGGFSVMSKFYNKANEAEWQELQTRWHQFGAFVPLFRAHGQWPQRELWNIAQEGSKAYETILWYMQLRYRLMPYIYSLASAMYFEDGTLMRGLPMDYPNDPEVRDLSDQWLFGPALMPCPVYEYKARSRSVYFPEGTWYDFYSGEVVDGGSRITVDAPYERMPLYVRAGSIIPVGPEIEWTDEKPADDLLIVIYAGADSSFTLYEDDGLTYGYEKGESSRITFSWDDAAGTLTIGRREGSYPGMIGNRSFRVVLCNEAQPFAWNPDAAGQEVKYSGYPLSVKL